MRSGWSSLVPILAFSMGGALDCAQRAPPKPASGGAPTESSAPLKRPALPPPSASTEMEQRASVPGACIEAARIGRWDEVARTIDALSPAAKNTAAIRYLRARAALALSDPALAIVQLERLESELPLLGQEIARDRSAAMLDAGPYEEAAQYYSRRGGAKDLVQAALAWERGHQLERAFLSADRAVELGRRSREIEAAARAVRARVAEQLGKPSISLADWRWLATVTPTAPASHEAAQQLQASARLTAEEHYQRALAFARAGDVSGAEAEVSLQAADRPLARGEVLHIRGWARYTARAEPATAADLLEKASLAGSEDPARDLFYSGRARSRAEEDDRAIRAYLQVVSRFPKSAYAEEASYMAARQSLVQGHWDQAASAYTNYLGRYGKRARFAGAVEYERAVAWLIARRGVASEQAFRQLLGQAEQPALRARYRELHAVALLILGRREQARQEFQKVVADAPLSFPALVSAARLKELGDPLPAWLEPFPSDAPRPSLRVSLPPKVSLLHELGLDTDAERALADHESEFRLTHAGRADEALCLAYGMLGGAAGRTLSTGQRAGRRGELDHAPSSTARWLWDCAYPRPYWNLVREVERKYELPNNLVYAIIRAESGFRSDAASGASAIGLMQLLPATAARLATELGWSAEATRLESPYYNIHLGSYYLSRLLRRFRSSAPLAIMAYNAGPQAVTHWLESGEKLPLDLFVARIPYAETRTYVCRVLGNLARYAYLEAGAAAVPDLASPLPQAIRKSREDY